MRVLSLIPALFLAAASFVAAAPSPAPAPVTDLSARDDANTNSLVGIFTTLTAQINSASSEINATIQSGGPVNATYISDIISDVIVNIRLVGDVNVTAAVNVDLQEIVPVLNNVVSAILTLLYAVLAFAFHVTDDILHTVAVVLRSLVPAVNGLLAAVTSLLGGTESALATLIAAVQSTVALVLQVTVN